MYLAPLMRELQLGQLFGCNPDELLDQPSWKLSWWLEIDALKKQAEAGNGGF